MIDTGKYEGHSEGEWYWSPDGLRCKTHLVYPSHRNILWNGTPPHPPKDMKLIADAPLLLAEVKQLREVQKKIGSLICDECGLSIEEHIRYHTENDVTGGCPFGED